MSSNQQKVICFVKSYLSTVHYRTLIGEGSQLATLRRPKSSKPNTADRILIKRCYSYFIGLQVLARITTDATIYDIRYMTYDVVDSFFILLHVVRREKVER